MDLTAIHNRQDHPIYVMIAMYQDRQYSVAKLRPKTSLSIGTHLLASSQVFIVSDEAELEDLEGRLGPEFRRVKYRSS